MSKLSAGAAAAKRRPRAAGFAAVRLCCLGYCLLALLFATATATATATAAAPLRVFVSILPVKTFVERIGGDRVQVAAMVQPGSNPHTYEPTPRQVAALSDTELYFRIGVPFEQSWMDRIRSMNPEMKVIDLRAGLAQRNMRNHDHPADANHAHASQDFHIWTNPRLVISMAAHIRDALTRADPAGAAEYAANYQAFAADLRALDGEIRSLFAGLDNRRFLVFHPAWGYFADAYGLEQIAIEVEGKPPGAASLARLIERAKREDIHTIFVQRQFSAAPALAVARAIDARVVRVDPLAENYTASLRQFARSLREAMR
ncbi:MAG: zinc ABC transporter substrate-binding protein [Nitrococcus sp.]|nr:zinc ABC transporter substrate-binding protein [Nitrococcus sp.]